MIYQYNKAQCNLSKLTKELLSYPVEFLVHDNGIVYMHTTGSLSPEDEQAVSAIVAAHTTTDTIASIQIVIERAMQFGKEIIAEFAAENVLLGITQDNQTGVVLDKLQSLLVALQSGSLHEAISRIRAIPENDYDAKYITAARLLTFLNKIETYLGIDPLSEEL